MLTPSFCPEWRCSSTCYIRWSGDVIWRTGKKNFNAVSHNRARPQVLFPNSLQHFHRQNSTDQQIQWMNIQVDSTSSNLASAMLNLKIRLRAVVGYDVKIFHPSPPNYVTRSPGWAIIFKFDQIRKNWWRISCAEILEVGKKFFRGGRKCHDLRRCHRKKSREL